MIKKFYNFINESVSDINSIFMWLQSEFKECQISKTGDSNDIKIDIEYCPIEPEVGSYTYRANIDISIKELNGLYEVSMDGVYGEYGCEEDDSEFGCEMDWQNGHDIKGRLVTEDLEKIKSFINGKIEDIL